MARAISAVALAAVLAVAAHASADGSVLSASAEYEAGAAAYDKRNWATAAQHLSRADEQVPNPTVLKLAMLSCQNLPDGDVIVAPLAMSLAERAEQRGADVALAQLAKKLRQKFADAAARVKVGCPASLKCQATVDGKDVEVGTARWVLPGAHKVQVRADNGGSMMTEVRVNAGGSITVSPSEKDLAPPDATSETTPAPAAATAPIPPDSTEQRSPGLSPVYFLVAAGATLVGTGISTFLVIENGKRNEEYLASGKTAETALRGQEAQTRMQISWGATGVLAVVTLVLGLYTDWSGSSAKTAASR